MARRSGLAAIVFVMCDEKSVVPSFGHASETVSAPGTIFFITMRKWSNALRPYE